jgi:putative alpha-1,2-mannosidase
MKKHLLVSLILLFIFLHPCVAQSPADYANPLIGTKGLFLYGRTTPFVTLPFGMTHFTPVTRKSRIAVPLYNYFDTRIRGFRASHKPAMWMGDYGHVTLKPVIGELNSKALKSHLLFLALSAETSKTILLFGRFEYRQKLKKIKTEMTATATVRCAEI